MIVPIDLALIDNELVSVLTLIAAAIVPIGLALIVYKLVSVLTLIAVVIVPLCLALMVYKLVSVLTLIAVVIVPIGLALIVYEISYSFDINSKVKLSCTWIDTCLRNPCGVGHLPHWCLNKSSSCHWLVHASL